MKTLFKYIISLSALLLVFFGQQITHTLQHTDGSDFTVAAHNTLLGNLDLNESTTHNTFASSNHTSGHHLFGVETSENGAEEDDDRSHKKFSAFGDFLKALFHLQKAVVSIDIHEEEEIFQAHEFKSSSFKSLFLVLEVFRL